VRSRKESSSSLSPKVTSASKSTRPATVSSTRTRVVPTSRSRITSGHGTCQPPRVRVPSRGGENDQTYWPAKVTTTGSTTEAGTTTCSSVTSVVPAVRGMRAPGDRGTD
jgi:hypothetical protein